MADIFISYARSERARAEVIKARLEELKLTVFFDVEGLDGGDVFPDVLDREVKSAGVVLGLWSPHALTRPWIKTECRIGKDRGVLLPAAIEPIDAMSVPAAFYDLQIIDLTDFHGDIADANWVKLIRAMARTLKRPGLLESESAAQAQQAPSADEGLRQEMAALRAELEQVKAASRPPAARTAAPQAPRPTPSPAAPAPDRRAAQWVLGLLALAVAGAVFWWLVDQGPAVKNAEPVWLEEAPPPEERAALATPEEENLAAAEDYLAHNASQDGVVTTASGLQYKVLASGPADGLSPVLGQWVCVHYRGSFISGEEFDSSYSRNQALAIAADRVISGWVEAIFMMKPGDVWQLALHPNLAYGPQGGGVIPPNSLLLFDVSLIDVLEGPAEAGVDCAA